MNELVRKFQLKDTDYEVSAEIHDAHVEFYVFETGASGDANTDYLFSGYVKWDGCSNWDFQSFNKRVGCTHPLHFCSKEDAVEFGVFLGQLYDWTAELIKVLTDEEVASWGRSV